MSSLFFAALRSVGYVVLNNWQTHGRLDMNKQLLSTIVDIFLSKLLGAASGESAPSFQVVLDTIQANKSLCATPAMCRYLRRSFMNNAASSGLDDTEALHCAILGDLVDFVQKQEEQEQKEKALEKPLDFDFSQITPKKKTEAFKKVEKARAIYLPDEHDLIQTPCLSASVYLYINRDGKPCVLPFRGRATAVHNRFSFKSEGKRNKWVREFIESSIQTTERRKPKTRGLEVGDVLYSSWGYEQTNIDYYLVQKLVGKTSVEIVEIGQKTIGTSDMCNDCIPDPGNIIGEPIKKRVDGESVRINSHIRASKKSYEVIAGARIYSKNSSTSYH